MIPDWKEFIIIVLLLVIGAMTFSRDYVIEQKLNRIYHNQEQIIWNQTIFLTEPSKSYVNEVVKTLKPKVTK
jgi:hypothetical protein